MPIKWLECSVQYSPDNSPNKQYLCSFVDYYKKDVTIRVSGEYVYVDYVGPPGAPFIAKGHIRVDLVDYGETRGVVSFPCRTSAGASEAGILMSKLEFVPKPIKKTLCLIRKKK